MSKVVKQKNLTLAEVVEILEEIRKKRELTSIETYTLDYAKKFSKTNAENARKAVEELVKLGLPDNIAVQLVNIMPEDEDEIRALLAPYMKALTSDQIKGILEVLGKYKAKPEG